MSRVKKDILFYAIIFVTLVFAFLPHNQIPHDIDSINTNYLHVISFFVISFYLKYFKKIKILNIFYFTILFGFFIEIFQGLFTTREFSLLDVVFDIIGFGLVLLTMVVKENYFYTLGKIRLLFKIYLSFVFKLIRTLH